MSSPLRQIGSSQRPSLKATAEVRQDAFLGGASSQQEARVPECRATREQIWLSAYPRNETFTSALTARN